MATARQGENTISQEVIPSNLPSRPTVLVFDSGVGGLSVYDEIRQLLPDLHYIYAFDNEAFPYGEKSQQFIIERVVEIVNAVQLRHQLALVVIACNTASTISLPALRERFTFPVVGVVPAVKPAAKLTRNGVVGLLATRATVQRSYTHELIARFATDCQILSLGSSELVELAEAKLQGEMISISELQKILRPWLRLPEPPDTVVLGCTHFPLLAEELKAALPDGTRLVDSGAAIARRTAWLIANLDNPALSTDKNLVYCLAITPKVATLWPILQRYGFDSLEKLPL
ncbi:glutamate racemase [Pectobacterium quasiaquaticum]|uniref:Glutamate racemase n=1 Tax=Pectobacterium quasiaquaticum TaxID=2774015 RepID=A0A9Q2EXT1_9GAMM|nr:MULTISPECIES: glutamate racemase [Pectobacterium]MBE5201958.1 glutamate racemase [Pectobacterium quasiaquaticum]MBE5211419.1 glutamate racemase [Pectobacterium quasiaquaticum]MBE5215364.1 glutamate racemase [Pectobacterium quasiaquaticum]MBE5221022.1 glutamate racemase [Pectobacterium quasiaquaticum]MBE5224929.1 glutamate racemase [Pectobacterium quasiaquaticum]